MYTVLLDSSNVNLSVGLAKDDVLLKEISYEAWQQQSESSYCVFLPAAESAYHYTPEMSVCKGKQKSMRGVLLPYLPHKNCC